MKNFTIVLSQNLTDLCLQIYGDTQFLYQIAKDNGLEIDSDVRIGDIISYVDTIGVSKIKSQTEIKSTNYFNTQNVSAIDYLTDGIETILTDGSGNPFPTTPIL